MLQICDLSEVVDSVVSFVSTNMRPLRGRGFRGAVRCYKYATSPRSGFPGYRSLLQIYDLCEIVVPGVPFVATNM